MAEEGITIVYRKSHTQSASQLYRKNRDALIKKGSRKATMKQIHKPLDYIIQNVRETILGSRHHSTARHCWGNNGEGTKIIAGGDDLPYFMLSFMLSSKL
jgi:hypothetical protein